MDYLEEAKEMLSKGLVPDENAATNLTRSIAYALVAIAERLDTWAQDSNEIEDLTDLQLEEQGARLTKLEDRVIDNGLANRVDNLEDGLRGIGVWREVVDERADNAGIDFSLIKALKEKTDEIERKLAGVVVQHVNDYAAIDRRLDDLEDELERKLNKIDGQLTSLGLWREAARERLNGLESQALLDEQDKKLCDIVELLNGGGTADELKAKILKVIAG